MVMRADMEDGKLYELTDHSKGTEVWVIESFGKAFQVIRSSFFLMRNTYINHLAKSPTRQLCDGTSVWVTWKRGHPCFLLLFCPLVFSFSIPCLSSWTTQSIRDTSGNRLFPEAGAVPSAINVCLSHPSSITSPASAVIPWILQLGTSLQPPLWPNNSSGTVPIVFPSGLVIYWMNYWWCRCIGRWDWCMPQPEVP